MIVLWEFCMAPFSVLLDGKPYKLARFRLRLRVEAGGFRGLGS